MLLSSKHHAVLQCFHVVQFISPKFAHCIRSFLLLAAIVDADTFLNRIETTTEVSGTFQDSLLIAESADIFYGQGCNSRINLQSEYPLLYINRPGLLLNVLEVLFRFLVKIRVVIVLLFQFNRIWYLVFLNGSITHRYRSRM